MYEPENIEIHMDLPDCGAKSTFVHPPSSHPERTSTCNAHLRHPVRSQLAPAGHLVTHLCCKHSDRTLTSSSTAQLPVSPTRDPLLLDVLVNATRCAIDGGQRTLLRDELYSELERLLSHSPDVDVKRGRLCSHPNAAFHLSRFANPSLMASRNSAMVSTAHLARHLPHNLRKKLIDNHLASSKCAVCFPYIRVPFAIPSDSRDLMQC
ncbi:hypothetical protein HPB51_026826 [Rhipicephalus microplus]|uniref:Uncharacterized protein n=1 Tax=Rhipicephalus microplus TaxID=6941 RepID=A0A9J6D214_RHIMP|nr:hypothetical protein HPB51_026826 [Rhipicephalus microplus]